MAKHPNIAKRKAKRIEAIRTALGDFHCRVERVLETGMWRYKRKGEPWVELGVGYYKAKKRALEIGAERRGII